MRESCGDRRDLGTDSARDSRIKTESGENGDEKNRLIDHAEAHEATKVILLPKWLVVMFHFEDFLFNSLQTWPVKKLIRHRELWNMLSSLAHSRRCFTRSSLTSAVSSALETTMSLLIFKNSERYA